MVLGSVGTHEQFVEDIQEESEQGTLRYTAPGQRSENPFGSEEAERYPEETGNDTLTDATMLDSVVLPTIVSVSVHV